MPKIIENVREKLLAEARLQVEELGYSQMTIRSVAKAAGVASGTVYNYFPSKEMMVASFMSEDWHRIMNDIKKDTEGSKDLYTILDKTYSGISSFANLHRKLFMDEEAKKGFAGAYLTRKEMLVGQIADLFRPLCKEKALDNTDHLPEFLAESLMTWVTEQRDIAELYIITKRLFK